MSSAHVAPGTLDRIEALRPGVWRVSNLYGTYDILRQSRLRSTFGTRFIYNLQDVFSAQWGFPVSVGPTCVSNSPRYCFSDYATLRTKWADFLEQFLTAAEAQNAPIDGWDVFSEPDWSWQGITEDQFYELFRLAHDTIRRHRPDAFLVAPSVSKYDETGLRRFLAFVASNGLRVNGVSWHEIEGGPEQVAEHARSARTVLVADFADAGALRPSELHINEYAPGQSHLVPGWTVGWLAAFEAARIDVVSRGCWPATASWTDCEDGLDGLLMQDNVTPQANYFVHQAWADLPASRWAVQSTAAGLSGVAGASDAGTDVLLGRASCGTGGAWCRGANAPSADEGFPPVDVDLVIETTHTGPVAATAERIPGSGLAAPSTPVIEALDASVAPGNITVRIAALRDGEACVVHLRY